MTENIVLDRGAGPKRNYATPADWFVRQFGAVGPLPVLLVIAFGYFSAVAPTFATVPNMTDLLQRSVFLLLMASGQLLILITGGFDLSVAAVVSFVSIVGSQVMANTFLDGTGSSQLVAVLASLAMTVLVGAIVGLVNGLGVALLKINPFIVTLAVATILGGVTLIVSGGVTVGGLPDLYSREIANGSLFGIPWLVVLTAPVIIALVVLTNYSVFGVHLYALGDNATAARIAGVRVDPVMITAYVLGSALTAYASWLLTARIGSGQPTMGGSYTMESLTAAIIGGASLRGGKGTIVGVFLGVLFMQILTNGMNLMQLDSNRRQIAIGLALVFAVLIDRLRNRARDTSAAKLRSGHAQ
ncbi:ABC transporter permease [Nocardia sp. NPDC047038]|uniref:ABC transporter permease n=1 Tax=Nocardia sp. NPDC047038 TaxID=3154338 RepID=UPI0033CAB288